MALSRKSVSEDSSTDANRSSSDDRDDRFYSQQPLVRRKSASSLSSSGSSDGSASDDSSGPPDVPKRPLSSNPVKAKRPRDNNGEEEEEPKKKIAERKPEAGKKPQPIPKKPEGKIPSSKDSPQKPPSNKKPLHAWSADDEVALVKGVLALLNADAPELPKNMVPIYEQVKHLLSHDYSNSQLYDKMRRMKSKFQTISEKVKDGGRFSFKNPHDATMFGLWKQLWSRPSNAAAGPAHGNDVKVRKAEEDEEEGQDRKAQIEKSQNAKRFPSANAFGEESRAVVNTVRNGLQKMMEDAHLGTGRLVDSLFKARTLGTHRPSGDPASGMHRARGLPVLSSKKAQALERKWREQHILEMEAFSRRLDLLQEECSAGLEELKSPGEDVGRA